MRNTSRDRRKKADTGIDLGETCALDEIREYQKQWNEYRMRPSTHTDGVLFNKPTFGTLGLGRPGRLWSGQFSK